MATQKMTKTQYFARLIEIVNAAHVEDGSDLVDFVQKQIDQIETKALKAKEKAEEKKAEGDSLLDKVKDAVGSEWQCIDEITDKVALEVQDVTRSKVTTRLTKLVKEGVVEKELQKLADKTQRKAMCYRLVPVKE